MCKKNLHSAYKLNSYSKPLYKKYSRKSIGLVKFDQKYFKTLKKKTKPIKYDRFVFDFILNPNQFYL